MAWIGLDLLRRRQIKGLVFVLLGFGALASVHFLYNKIMTGNALLPPAVHDARGNEQARIGVSWDGFGITAIRLFWVLDARTLSAQSLLFPRKSESFSFRPGPTK
jgi:hypothetical protein